MEISHDSHPHRLVLKSANCPYYCGGCDQLGFGLSYVCNISGCNFFLHKQCGNPQSLVEYPFSTKCVLKFSTQGSGWQDSSCVACGKKIKGFHYRCLCTFVKRNLHPFCLSYKQTLEGADGLTLYLKKEATTNCLHCQTTNIGSRVRGWAYVSRCGNYCYHVSCVMEIINTKWRNGIFNGKSDPFQTVKQDFPADKDRMEKLVAGRGRRNEQLTWKKVGTVLSLIFNALTGNHAGLVGGAASYFS